MSTEQSSIYFGGPDLKKNLLRDELLDRIKNTDPNGKILWVCYYLNDPQIVEALIAAANRNVYVDIIIDIASRRADINDDCINTLDTPSIININVTRVILKNIWHYLGIRWNPHLHSKLYYFSSPHPHVLIGSYNPTAGSDHLTEQQLSEIGDHSISHNVLASISEPEIIEKLIEYTTKLQSPISRKFSRLTNLHNSTHRYNQWSIDFLPSLNQHPVDKLLTNNDDNATIKCAISHLKGPGFLRSLKIALKKGKKIEIVLENNERRISKQYVSFFDKHQIQYHQPTMNDYCLMHNKFIIYKSNHEHRVMFGSFNWSTRSRYLNHEIIACTDNVDIVNKFEMRWQQLISLK